jgi:nitrogen fixation protein NifU and related proteins
MSDLRELYQELIIDHSKRPRNFKVLEAADRKVEGYNPLCGDKITLFLELEHDRVKNVSFQGSGCAISTASASVMTESVKGKTLAEVEALFEVFHDMVTGKPPAAGNAPELGKLAVFSGVSEFPARIKCATLAWHTLHAALQGNGDTVSTE